MCSETKEDEFVFSDFEIVRYLTNYGYQVVFVSESYQSTASVVCQRATADRTVQQLTKIEDSQDWAIWLEGSGQCLDMNPV